MDNFCVIDQNGGKVKVTCTANNGVRANVAVGVYKHHPTGEWELVEQLNLVTGDDGEDAKEVVTSPSTLIGKFITWNVNFCAFVPGAIQSTITIKFSQDGVDLPTTEPTKKVVSDPPKCQNGQMGNYSDKLKIVAS